MNGVIVAAQDGYAQLAQQLTGDVTMQDIARGAEAVTGLGLTAAEAGVLITVLLVALKVIESMRAGGLFITLNDWVRRVLGLHPANPPPPPKP